MKKKVNLNENNKKKSPSPTFKQRKNNRYVNSNTNNINNQPAPQENDYESEDGEETLQEDSSYTNEEFSPTASYLKQKKANSSKAKNTVVNDLKVTIRDKILKKIVIKLSIIAIPALFVLILILFAAAIIVTSEEDGMVMGSYYTVRCPEVTVIFTDKNNDYEVTDTATYPIEEYVAGVVAGEVGFLGSIEVDKVFAVAARTYLLTHDDGNCTIESSDRKQVFRELTDSYYDKLALQAAKDTQGQVLLSNDELYGTQYDAFACIAKDNNYYTISQANQKIPIEWIESRISPTVMPSWFICNGRENLQNHHGNGLSQYGSLYLALEEEYTYDQILEFYLSEYDVVLSRGTYMTSIAGLEVKDTTSTNNLDTSLESFLLNNGSSIEELNNFIHESVIEAGKGTRAGVVTAAVSLINYLNDNYGVRIPYYWGGSYQHYGVSPNFGKYVGPSCSDTTCYFRSGLDCSGFISWAIKNGGYNFNRLSTYGFDDRFSSDSCNISSDSCIGQPGDLINSRNCHVQMIVAVDEESGQYIVAESTGGNMGVIMRKWNMHASNCGTSETKILHMDKFYNDSSNTDPNY